MKKTPREIAEDLRANYPGVPEEEIREGAIAIYLMPDGDDQDEVDDIVLPGRPFET